MARSERLSRLIHRGRAQEREMEVHLFFHSERGYRLGIVAFGVSPVPEEGEIWSAMFRDTVVFTQGGSQSHQWHVDREEMSRLRNFAMMQLRVDELSQYYAKIACGHKGRSRGVASAHRPKFLS